MKLFITAIFAIAITTMSFGQTIVGSAHDFSGTWATNPNTAQTEVCIACHTPHNADLTVADAPLWNHEVTVAAYTLYDSPTFDGVTTIGQPSGTSKLCLSCHDGTVNLQAFGGAAGTTPLGAVASNLGTDLSSHHPISFNYDAAQLLDAGIFVSTTTSGLGSDIATDLLFGTHMECASCHDVHNQGVGSFYLLNKDNAASALCLTCHDK